MSRIIQTDVCIAGGGPAGAMLALLLAETSGLDIVLLEQHQAFQREFRGESISQGSVAMLDALGILDKLKRHGYLEVEGLAMYDKGEKLLSFDFNDFPYPHKFTIDLPQPVLIGAILDKARAYPNFRLHMGAAGAQLVEKDGRIAGLVYREKSGDLVTVESSIVVDATGRYTRLREMAGLEAKVEPLKRDAVWFRLPRPANWDNATRIKVDGEHHLIALPTYPDQLRIGLNIEKGSYKEVRKQPIDVFYEKVLALEPLLDGLLQQHIQSWNDTVLLDIFTAEVPSWSRDGLVLIGDAAHTVSPILGQGVNLAIQDAYVLAPVLKDYLAAHPKSIVPSEVLKPFEQSRKEMVAFIQRFQADQEEGLHAASAEAIAARKMKMRALDQSPAKLDLAVNISYGIFKEIPLASR